MKLTAKHIRIVTCLVAMLILFGVLPVCAAEPTVEVKIPVSCTGKNTNESFSYHLNAETKEFQKMAVDYLSMKNGETNSFSVLYTYPGTYHYTVTQSKGTDSKTTYDETVYTVDVYVTEDENGKMSAEPIIYLKGSNEKKQSASFTNTKEVEVSKKTGSVKTGDMVKDTLLVSFLGLGTVLIGLMIIRKKEDI